MVGTTARDSVATLASSPGTGWPCAVSDSLIGVFGQRVQGDVDRVLGGTKMDMLLTDPPYCSGGFQESGKAAGSVGTRGTEMIANDTLSTRGYMALIKATIPPLAAGVVYARARAPAREMATEIKSRGRPTRSSAGRSSG